MFFISFSLNQGPPNRCSVQFAPFGSLDNFWCSLFELFRLLGVFGVFAQYELFGVFAVLAVWTVRKI